MNRIRRASALLAMPFRVPLLGISSLVYSALLYAASLKADLLDIGNPWWVATTAVILLASPFYHAVAILAIASYRQPSHSPRQSTATLERFPSLLLGQLVVNLAVVLGSMLFVLPGILVGLRTIYYKQVLVLEGGGIRNAIAESFKRTIVVRELFQTLGALGLLYCLPIATEFFLLPELGGVLQHIVAVAVTTAFLAWINAYVTERFVSKRKDEAKATVI